MQFRYYGDGDNKNYPLDITTYENLTNGNIFGSYAGISKIGIQCRPGVYFYLNGEAHPIEIGETGIYELDLGKYGYVNKIQFAAEPEEGEAIGSGIDFLKKDGTERILIDIIYEGSGVSI